MNRRTLLMVIALNSFFGAGRCQDQTVMDSIGVVVGRSTGAEKYDALHQLVVNNLDHDNEEALKWAILAEEAARAIRDRTLIIRSKQTKAHVLFRLGRPQEVLSVLKDVELDDKLEELTDVHLSILNLFGTSYVLMSQFDESLKYFFKAYTLAKQANQMEHQAISLKNIGVVYYKLKDYRKALPFMIEGEKVSDRLQNEDYMSSMNISLCYTHLKDFPNAKIYLEKSIQICGATCNAQSMTHINYASGCLNLGLKNYEAAEGDFLKSLTYAKEASDFRMQLDNIYQLSEISISQKHLAKAEMFLETGNSIISDGTPYNMEMIKIYEQMSQLYLSMKRYEQAVRYQSRYIAL